jgi:hypothetical protein
MKKEHIFHGDVVPDDITFQFSSVLPLKKPANEKTGWIMYNHQ